MGATSAMDVSLPISTLLQTETKEAHETTENSQGATWLARGELDRSEYVRFLMMMWHVYDTLERALERHASHPTLHPTYNPTVLARTSSLAADICYFLQLSESSWKSDPLYVDLMSSPPAPFLEYTARIQEVADSSDPSPLLAHAYVRYLGDLSGGQFIRRRIKKVYELEDGDDNLGVKFYDFKELGGTRSGTMGDFKRIKEWYRAGMDSGVGNNNDLKVAVLEEADRAFLLNTGIFTVLKPPSGTVSQPVSEATPDESKDKAHPVETPVQIEHAKEERLVTLGNVIALVGAICLAHFLLVTGGFTGSQAHEKLVELWYNTVTVTHA